MVVENAKRDIIGVILLVVSIIMVVYHLLVAQYPLLVPTQHKIAHLGFALVIVFLEALRSKKNSKLFPVVLLFLLASIAVIAYMLVRYDYLELYSGHYDITTLVFGVLLVVVVMEASRLKWGKLFLILSGIFIAYMAFGHLLPEPLGHLRMPIKLQISDMGIGLDGIMGSILGASANFVFLFIIFGVLLEVVKAQTFFFEVGKLAGRKVPGGPAQIAVISSSMVGTVTGNTMANVIFTGSFTIPLMKKYGYRPEVAGAVEAVASTGGQIMPPILGAAAFIMAAITGIPYVEIMVASIIPAVFYYLAVFLAVMILAKREQIPMLKDKIDKRVILVYGQVFFIPLAVMIVLLLQRFSPMFSAFYAIVSIVVISLLRKETRPSLKRLADGMVRGAIMGSSIAIASGAVGIAAKILTSTGLGQKLAFTVELLSGGNVILLLIITALLSIMLGTGMPTLAAYVLVGVVVAPALVRADMPLLAAHFFVFYYAIMACITPPVASGAMAAAPIAGSSYIKTAVHAFRLGLTGFIMPFVFIFNPAFLLHPTDTVWAIISMIAFAMTLVVAAAVNYGFLLNRLSSSQRLICAISAIGLVGFCLIKSYMLLAVGVVLFAVIMVLQWRTRRALLSTELKIDPNMG